MSEHRFIAGGACVYCKTTPESVADRRAPPFCTEAPDEPDTREDADGAGGY